uniref:Mitochondrial transcription termination factor family protein n=1 Tax=Rhizophora mucronata TaxID=61149 RepID=A0A2P2IZG2_RHIMU
MRTRPCSLIEFCFLFVASRRSLCFRETPHGAFPLFAVRWTAATCSTLCQTHVENGFEEDAEQPKDSMEVLRRWGCSENDILKLIGRRPSLRNADLTSLHSKLGLLQDLGITSKDLVKIINCRPRLLSCCISNCFEERTEYLMSLFGSGELLRKAIIRNPSLLTYDLHNTVKPVIALYEQMGVRRGDLITMILSRPTLIPRTSFDKEKMEYILKAGVPKDSKLYKYIVTIVGISRVETIRLKVATFEKWFSEEEVWSLFGRCPILLTLSIDKVQRNMTFVVGVMKIPADVVLKHPFLLSTNLEAVLKPRVLLAAKMEDMNLCPKIKGPLMLTALRMTEKRFLNAFISCHPKGVIEKLLEFYGNAKGIKRLAEASKKSLHQGFPF